MSRKMALYVNKLVRISLILSKQHTKSTLINHPLLISQKKLFFNKILIVEPYDFGPPYLLTKHITLSQKSLACMLKHKESYVLCPKT